jgi:hypothetical protein
VVVVADARVAVRVLVERRAEELEPLRDRWRTPALFWPMPPVKTTASTPPITAA